MAAKFCQQPLNAMPDEVSSANLPLSAVNFFGYPIREIFAVLIWRLQC